MDGTSLTPEQEKLNALKQVLPEVFAEGKVDWEKLKATLGEDINFSNERYVLNWAGKSEAFKVLQTPTTKTLVPDKEESVNFDETEHIFIEGENLEVLKVLQKSYFGKVKMIYIDPPYNTGNDSFIYPDKFSETKDEYEKRVGDKDDEGYMTKDGMFKKNSKENGQYHSNWLNMMMPRLYLAKNLLKQDGVIFVSIDDNEFHNLRLLMNEVFGEENFVAQLVWKKKTGSGSKIEKAFSEHEYILAYVRDSSCKSKWRVKDENDGNFQNPDNDERGPWESCAITAPSKNRNKNQLYKIEVFSNYDKPIENSVNLIEEFQYGNHRIAFRNIDDSTISAEGYDKDKKYAWFIRRWSYIPTSMREVFKENRVYLKNKNLPRFKKFETEYDGKALRSIYYNEFSTQQGGEELKELFGTDILEYPKPIDLIRMLTEATSEENDIVLDFFAGSCSTSHAVYSESLLSGIKRKFICVQLDERCEKDSDAFKAGFNTISEIAKERIRRAGKKLQEENPKFKGDLGFKVLKLSDSNFKQWQQITGKDKQALEEQMKLFVDPVAKNATTENMVYELLLKSGKDLNSTVEVKDGFYAINETELILVLEKANQEIIDAVIASKPQKVIALDKLFKGNDQLKTNASLQMKDAGIEFKTI